MGTQFWVKWTLHNKWDKICHLVEKRKGGEQLSSRKAPGCNQVLIGNWVDQSDGSSFNWDFSIVSTCHQLSSGWPNIDMCEKNYELIWAQIFIEITIKSDGTCVLSQRTRRLWGWSPTGWRSRQGMPSLTWNVMCVQRGCRSGDVKYSCDV